MGDPASIKLRAYYSRAFAPILNFFHWPLEWIGIGVFGSCAMLYLRSQNVLWLLEPRVVLRTWWLVPLILVAALSGSLLGAPCLCVAW